MNAESIATWARELSAIEDRVAEVQTEMRDQAATGRYEVKFLRERAKHLFGLISGREHEQLTLPATTTAVIDGDSPVFAEAIQRGRAVATHPCSIPGCGEPGKRVKGSPGLWCKSHGEKLSAVERKSITERAKRLATPAKKAAKRG